MYIKINNERIPITHFLPEEWIQQGTLTLTYSCFLAKFHSHQPPGQGSVMDLRGKRIVLINGQLEYSPRVIPFAYPAGDHMNANVGMITSESGWLMIVFQTKMPDIQATWDEELNELNEFSALVGIVFGHGLILKWVITNSHSFTFNGLNGEYTYEINIPVGILNPNFNIPILTNQKVNEFNNTYERLDQLEILQANRCRLGLNWYLKSYYESPIISFISVWTAIECIAIHSGTNIRPIKQHLAAILQIPINEVEHRSRIGAIFNLRSEIVHNGRLAQIDQFFCEYLRLIFEDIFNRVIGFNSAYKTPQIIDGINFNQYLNLE